MLPRCLLLLLLSTCTAATAAIGLTNASGLTGFPVKYDLLTVTVQHEVELIGLPAQQVATAFAEVEPLYIKFVEATEKDVAAHTLTWDSHGRRVDSVLGGVDRFLPGVSAATTKLLSDIPLDFFTFKEYGHAASWDVLYYGAATANMNNATRIQSKEIAHAIQKLHAEMKENIEATATKEELQIKVDSFFERAESISTGFQERTFDAIHAIYTSLWESDESSDQV